MSHVGLVLAGGGARAAYQVGALRAIAEIVGRGAAPFDVIAGISAGAINAVAVATMADDLTLATERLGATWAALTPDRIYRTGSLRMAGIGARWLRTLTAGPLASAGRLNYLLDSSPLRDLIESEIPIGRMRRYLRNGRLRGVAVSATSYETGSGVTFFEAAPDVVPWARSTRIGIRARIGVDHVMASAAIPVFFPPVAIGKAWYGDGCVRMQCPTSPAIHLGAERIVAISNRYMPPSAETATRDPRQANGEPLAMSEIAGLLLNSVFLDTLDFDVERLERINRTLQLVPRERRAASELRIVPALLLRPSQDLGRLAADEYQRFPAMLRYMLRGLGASAHAGEDLLSYLAFEPVYVKRVMDLGYADTLARRDEVAAFLGVGAVGPQRARARG